jgi:hypothetical protein
MNILIKIRGGYTDKIYSVMKPHNPPKIGSLKNRWPEAGGPQTDRDNKMISKVFFFFKIRETNVQNMLQASVDRGLREI